MVLGLAKKHHCGPILERRHKVSAHHVVGRLSPAVPVVRLEKCYGDRAYRVRYVYDTYTRRGGADAARQLRGRGGLSMSENAGLPAKQAYENARRNVPVLRQ